jgi:hypothetical protein
MMMSIKISDLPAYNGDNIEQTSLVGTIIEEGVSVTQRFSTQSIIDKSVANVVLFDTINVKRYGAVGDGITDDTPAFVAAVAALNARGGGVVFVPKGVYVCEDIALYFLTPIIMQGEGIGSGYGVPEQYLHNTSIIAKGTGEAFIRTRVRHRASISDPQDPALSAVITYGSEACDVRDIAIFCDADYTDVANDYDRANYSMGIFNQGYPQCRITNVDIYGPFSLASRAINATRATNMAEPLIPSLNVRFPKPPAHKVGVDGFTEYNVHSYGARWGEMLLGPKPSDINATNLSGGTYYDQEAAVVVSDFRNGIGASDWDSYSSSAYGGDQHNGFRWSDITDPEVGETEEERYARMVADADPFTGSGNLYISGIEMSKMRFYNLRSSGTSPFGIYMEYVNDVAFYEPHGDTRGFKTDAASDYVTRIDVKNTAGVDLLTLYPNGSGGVDPTKATYGTISTWKCDSNRIVGGTLNPNANYFEYDTDTSMWSNTSGVTRIGAMTVRDFSSESRISSTKDLVISSSQEVDIKADELIRFRKVSTTIATLSDSALALIAPIITTSGGDLDLRATSGSLIRFREGTNTLGTLSTSSLTLSCPIISTTGGDLDLRATSGSLIRFREGTSSLGTLSANGLTLFTTKLSLDSGLTGITVGTGSPETVVNANVGSLFLRKDGGAGTTLYVKESGTGSTGWIAK